MDYDDILLNLLDVLDAAAAAENETDRSSMITEGMRQLSGKAHFYPLRRLADQWQRLSTINEERKVC